MTFRALSYFAQFQYLRSPFTAIKCDSTQANTVFTFWTIIENRTMVNIFPKPIRKTIFFSMTQQLILRLQQASFDSISNNSANSNSYSRRPKGRIRGLGGFFRWQKSELQLLFLWHKWCYHSGLPLWTPPPHWLFIGQNVMGWVVIGRNRMDKWALGGKCQ